MLHLKSNAKILCFGKLFGPSRIFFTSTLLAITFSGVCWSTPTPVLAYPQRSAIAQRLAQSEIVQKMDALQTSQQRWIEIKLSSQRLIAWEGGSQVFAVTVSTGTVSTPTHPGIFAVQRKVRTERMRGSDYDVPDVPYTMYYHRGYAIHGAYWHENFGTPVSHGCTNLRVKDAKWLYQWASVGTPVIVHP
ncbi:MAG: L,D-transpeptidase [Prochloraceae cyanobacterium]|nr:L,D-transpeptidase [Prochloraceae cyanobacterium]